MSQTCRPHFQSRQGGANEGSNTWLQSGQMCLPKTTVVTSTAFFGSVFTVSSVSWFLPTLLWLSLAKGVPSFCYLLFLKADMTTLHKCCFINMTAAYLESPKWPSFLVFLLLSTQPGLWVFPVRKSRFFSLPWFVCPCFYDMGSQSWMFHPFLSTLDL